MTDPNFVTLSTDDPPVALRVLLGEERPEISAGYGGWQEIERPRRSTVTTWKGQPARRLSLSILFDNLESGTSLETDIRRLERMALPRLGGPPPVVRLDSAGGVIPWEKRTWVIDGIEWGSALMNVHGNRVRQAATVTFLEHVPDDLLEVRKAPAKRRQEKARRGAKRGAKASFYVVKRGDTLRGIAADKLGDAKRWRDIAQLNKIRDPRTLKVNTRLRLP